jgi:endonuclease YncB( thermonuclease family)
MRHQQLAKCRYALLVALVIPSLVSGCGQGPSSEHSPLPISVAEVEAQPSPAVVAANKPKTPAVNIIAGKTVGVTDGDTVTVLDATNTQHKIRLEAIDAPESHQPFGTQSKKALSEKVFGKAVRVEWSEKDKYRRTLGHIFIDDRWINREMVEEGSAWHYKQYSDDEDLAKLELTARAKKLGLWADKNAIAPWDFRHDPRLAEKVAVRSSRESSIQGVAYYATRSGKKYHRAGCRYLSKSSAPYSLADAQQRYGPCSHCRPPATKSTSQTATTHPARAASPQN